MGWVGLFWVVAACAAPFVSDSSSGETLRWSGGLWPVTNLVHPQPLEEELTFEKLVTLIEAEQLNRIEDVVPRLPWQMRDGNYVVMHRSRSLQDGPRVISFTPTARFILSFNDGHAAHAGHDTIEAIQFRMDQARFEFREITFDGHSRPHVSEPNPAKCLACHQAPTRLDVDLRPNWEPYNAWPGAIGAADGILGNSFAFALAGAPNPLRPQDLALVAEQAHEAEILQNFLTLAADHPRFRHLGGLRVDATANFTDLLAPLNFLRMLRLIRQEPLVHEATRAMLYAATTCETYDLDPALKPFAARAPWRYALEPEDSSYNLSRRLTWLFEGLGIDTSDWSMDFGTRGRFASFERFGSASHPNRFLAWALDQDPRTAELRSLGCLGVVPTATAKLSTYLAEGTPGARDPALLTPPVQPERILQRCARCHSAGTGIAPPIPFRDPEALRAALTRNSRRGRPLFTEISHRTGDLATLQEQMPPDERLTPEEAEALRAYLERLREI